MFFDDADPKVVASIGGRVYELKRARLKQFLVLEQLRKKKDVIGYLQNYGVDTSVGCGLEHIEVYIALLKMNRPFEKLPFLGVTSKTRQEDWDYEGRDVVSWVYTLMSHCHITLTELWTLSIDDFYGLLQELLIDEQFNKEWEYSLTDHAYEFSAGSNVGKYKPLERPSWMKIRQQQPKDKRPVPARFMPGGIVVIQSKNGSDSSNS